MNQSIKLLVSETAALRSESAFLSEASEKGWVVLSTVVVLLVLAVLGASARRWSRKNETAGPRLDPVPSPPWLSQESLAAIKATPVGPKTPDESKAYRLARLLIGELNEFCGNQVELGLRHKDLYARLRVDLDRSRETYLEMAPGVEKDFLQQEALHCVAKGDPAAFG